MNLSTSTKLFRGPLSAAALTLILAPANAQMTFSIDWHGPTRAMPDCATGAPISDATILAACGGAPAMPVVPGPLPPPMVVIPGGPGGLGLITAPPCAGSPGGAFCPTEVDALSYGFDGPVLPMPTPPGQWYFSVDEYAVGLPGVPFPPSVTSEAGGFGDAASDVFVDNGILGPGPLPPFATPPGNTAIVDGNGRLSLPSNYAYKGLGLIEPNVPSFLPPPDVGDNVDAIDMDAIAGPVPAGMAVFFSLDAGFIDPRIGVPNSGTAVAQGIAGVTGGAVLTKVLPLGPPVLYAPAPALGLDLFGFDTDDLDGLALMENGVPGFQPSMVPYDWAAAGGPDMLLFSVRIGSAIIGTPDSILGLPIQAGDILTTPAGGFGPPGIFIACENLGLMPGPTRGGAMPFGDDLDALDTWRGKELLASEYCYGDGGALPGCRPCACGNNAPAGSQTGCLNSSGTGTRLVASGLACVSADTLRFDISGAPVGSVAILQAGIGRLPLAGLCPPGTGLTPAALDGLRCIGGPTIRYGLRAVVAPGVGASPWGAPGGPAGGIIAAGGFAAGTTRQFQVTHRDFATVNCMTGLNTSNAVQIVFTP